MFILPLMAGHLFWKTTILVAFIEGFHFYIMIFFSLVIGYSQIISIYNGLKNL